MLASKTRGDGVAQFALLRSRMLSRCHTVSVKAVQLLYVADVVVTTAFWPKSHLPRSAFRPKHDEELTLCFRRRGFQILLNPNSILDTVLPSRTI